MYKVYLADDEYLVIRGLKNRIDWKKLNCEVVGSAQDGATALKEILDLGPDIVITDIVMPEKNGLDVIHEVSQRMNCAYIVFSGYSEFDYVKQALHLGTVDYLIKPVNISEIEESIIKAQERLNQTNVREKYSLAMDQYEQMQLVRLLNGLDGEVPGLAEYTVFITAILECSDDMEKPLREELKKLQSRMTGLFLAREKTTWVLVAAAREERDLVGLRKYIVAQLVQIHRQNSECYWGIGCACANAKELSLSHVRAKTMLNHCRFIRQQINEDYVFNSYDPSDFRGWIRDIAASVLQEENADVAYMEIHRLLQTAIQKQLSIRALGDLGRDLLYEMRQAFERTLGETADRGTGEIFGATRLGELSSIEEMEQCLYKTISEMRDFAYSQSLQLRQGQIDRIRAYIAQNLASPLTLMQIAESVRMNPSYVSHIFKKETGRNLFEYIAWVRISRAKELLRTTDWKIARISREVGYEDQRYFCQVFKRNVGITAGAYRCAAVQKDSNPQK